MSATWGGVIAQSRWTTFSMLRKKVSIATKVKHRWMTQFCSVSMAIFVLLVQPNPFWHKNNNYYFIVFFYSAIFKAARSCCSSAMTKLSTVMRFLYVVRSQQIFVSQLKNLGPTRALHFIFLKTTKNTIFKIYKEYRLLWVVRCTVPSFRPICF